MHINVKGEHPDRQLSHIWSTTGWSLLVVLVATYFLLSLTPHPAHYYWLGASSIPRKVKNNKTKAHPEFGCGNDVEVLMFQLHTTLFKWK